jgi:Abnormal spindle-like microcephaly-assoc'd, ASPM-SPD-2-Hydin/Cep192 domain 4/HYDIN/CFA65/VesB-like, Ig-like domain
LIAHRLHHRSGTILLILLIAVNLVLIAEAQNVDVDSSVASAVGVGTSTLNFGTVVIGNPETLPDKISNHTSAAVTVTAIQGLGSDFTVTGISLPLVLDAGQSASFHIEFKPSTLGAQTTTIAFVGSNAQTYVSLVASGIAVIRGNLSSNPSPVAFASTAVGASQQITATLLNFGGSNLIIRKTTMSGAGFAMANLALPLTLKPGQTAQLTVTFAPTKAGNFNGSISFATVSVPHLKHINMVVLSLSGSATAGAALSPSPSSLTFGNTKVGATVSQTETLTNTGGASATISQATASGAGFSISGPALPVTVASGQSAAFTVTYSPTKSGSASGSINIVSASSSSSVANLSLNIPLSGAGVASGALSATPASPNFGNVTVGSNQTLPVTITNTGGAAVTVSSASAAGAGFKFTGQNPPMTINGGQSATFSVLFTPTTTGAATGALTIISDASNSTLSVPLSGTGVAQGQLAASPSSLSFGNIQVGASKSLTAALNNSGGTSLTISTATASGSGFSLSGLALPLTLNAGQSTSFTVTYSPTASGAASGSVSIASSGSDANLTIPLAGTGVAQGKLAANPASLSFGNVRVDGNSSLPATLTNSGGSSLTISAASASGTGFSLSGLALPLTLNAGQSTSFTVTYSPTTSGAASGNVSVTSDGTNPTLSIPLSGTGQAAGALSSNPTSLLFGSVQVSDSTNLSETLTNTGGTNLTITQANVSGNAFSITGLTLPMTLTANQSVTFTATFAPTSAGAASSTLSVVSNASNSPLSIALSGTGAATGQLSVSPGSLSFGSVAVGSNASLTGSVTASGGTVKVTSASLSNSEFAVTGISLPLTLAAGQSASFSVTFTPQSSGATSASLSFSSNAANSSVAETMTGTGTTAIQHSVDLTWSASSDAVGYNVYRGTVSGGPYTMINATLNSSTSYTDNTVVSGKTYYYVATAVDSSSKESAYSTETEAAIPNP